ncbi:MAG TPA: cupin domain-containing protein [Fimbriimonadaceae bacterium]|nr:cupin domain-containing protein [Fimbriimonadaceae bacterium]
MSAIPYSWSMIPSDHPVELLHRQKIEGEQMLLARVHLEKGCHVALHHHVSEQMAIVIAGRVEWTLGEEGTVQEKVVMSFGEVLHIPANVWHGVDALEDTLIIDVLSPPGAMGVDSQQPRAH